MHGHRAITVAALAFLTGCSVSRGVRPLGDGGTAITATAGGPIADYAGGMKPLPLGTAGVAHGLTDTVDLHGAINWSTLALFGLFGAEAGVGWGFLDQNGAAPALMADVTVDLFSGDLSSGEPEGGARVYTELDLRASWAWSRHRHLVYLGPTAILQAQPGAAIPSWSLGNQFTLRRLDLITEARWMAPFTDNKAATVDYLGIGDAGALSVQLGARYRFGGAR